MGGHLVGRALDDDRVDHSAALFCFLLLDLVDFEGELDRADNIPVNPLDLLRGRRRVSKDRVQLLLNRFLLDRKTSPQFGEFISTDLVLGTQFSDLLFVEGADCGVELFLLGRRQNRN